MTGILPGQRAFSVVGNGFHVMVRQGPGDRLGTTGAKKPQTLVRRGWGQAGFRDEVGAEGVAGSDDGLQVGVEVASGRLPAARSRCRRPISTAARTR